MPPIPFHTRRILDAARVSTLVAVLACGVGVSAAAAQSPPEGAAPMATRNAGDTRFNVADRTALTHLIHAYAIEVDRFNIEGWFTLFTDDAVFSVALPGMTPVEQTGDSFRSFWRARSGEFERSGNRRKHLISNILFVEQTDRTAHAVISGLITNAKDGKTFTVVSGVDYEGWFVKQGGVWRIKRWNDLPDVNFESAQ
jgi:hypothetical protein